MNVVSVNIGRPRLIVKRCRRYSTAIDRVPANGSVALTKNGLSGDRVADAAVHGGPDKAVCSFPLEHYAHFEQRLNRKLTPASFGENLTLQGLLETEAAIGDVYRVGSATVQVSQPRQPCWKLAFHLDAPDIVNWINSSALTGFYLRVTEAGDVKKGDRLELLDRPETQITIAAIHEALLAERPDREFLVRAATLPALSDSWRARTQKRLDPQHYL